MITTPKQLIEGIKKIFDLDEINSPLFFQNTNLHFFLSDFMLIDSQTQKTIYQSPRYDDLEQYLDELIIFKELILPKYL